LLTDSPFGCPFSLKARRYSQKNNSPVSMASFMTVSEVSLNPASKAFRPGLAPRFRQKLAPIVDHHIVLIVYALQDVESLACMRQLKWIQPSNQVQLFSQVVNRVSPEAIVEEVRLATKVAWLAFKQALLRSKEMDRIMKKLPPTRSSNYAYGKNFHPVFPFSSVSLGEFPRPWSNGIKARCRS